MLYSIISADNANLCIELIGNQFMKVLKAPMHLILMLKHKDPSHTCITINESDKPLDTTHRSE